MNSLNLAIVEDDPEVRWLLSDYLHRQPGLNVVMVCESAEHFLAELPDALPPHVVLLDLGLPGLSGLEALPLIKQRLPKADVIVQTVFEDPDRIYLALSRGASGYLLKSTPLAQMQQAISDVARGGSSLSPSVARRVLSHFKPGTSHHPAGLSSREQQVFEGLIDGLADKEIAQRLGLGLETVHTHVKNVYHKLRVSGRIELLSRAARGQL
ncbi:response regulator transcription factor [Hymenobacter arizonensis]|uniref:DNA-binding response regulator, NarL/FixJ family, contains REC and HTH domains n=1 Tax=Hymenobacter arizonensis TaxID=1227077 RepID=A0A1I5T0Y1_HYMAR|nr:response regulator transcription factor [Hymenobacter arizonensis]SFP76689.1 DNA-binding response regulator, NarL/FixJ family, contains REC and HTH domains [Hymenobacter arizonensis]